MERFGFHRSLAWLFPGRGKDPALNLEGAAPEPRYRAKRRYPRFSAEGKNVVARMISAQTVELRNMSVTGVCVCAPCDVRAAESYFLQLSDDKPDLHFRCVPVWKRAEPADDGLTRYVAGLKFLALTSGDIVALKDFMRACGVPDARTVPDEFARSALRYYCRETKAVLSSEALLPVRKISLGGMLMSGTGPVETGSRHRFLIRYERGNEPIRVNGRVASVVPSSEISQPFDIGVAFLGVDEHRRSQLDRLIRVL